MKTIIMLSALIALSGCATTGLNVSWSFIATYNTPHATPGAPTPVEQAGEARK